MKWRFEQTIGHKGDHRRACWTFEATDLEVRWLKAWDNCSAADMPGLDVAGLDLDDPAFDLHIDDQTLRPAPADTATGPNPFIDKFLDRLGDEPAYELDPMVGEFTRDELETIARLWKFPDWCCAWRDPSFLPRPKGERLHLVEAPAFRAAVAAEVERIASAKLARAAAQRRTGQRLIKKADEATKTVEWYRAEAATTGKAARATALKGYLDGASAPLDPNLPGMIRGKLDELSAELAGLVANSPNPEAVREVRAHLLMVRRHLELAREDLAVRLWAAPVREIGDVRPSRIWLSKIRERCDRIRRVGVGDAAVSVGRVCAEIGDAVEATLGKGAARQVFPDHRSIDDRQPPHDGTHFDRWGRTLRSPDVLAITTAAERVIRDVYPRLCDLGRAVVGDHLPIEEAVQQLQAQADREVADTERRLSVRSGTVAVRARVVHGGYGRMGLHLDFEPCADADGDLLRSVLRELEAEERQRQQRVAARETP